MAKKDTYSYLESGQPVVASGSVQFVRKLTKCIGDLIEGEAKVHPSQKLSLNAFSPYEEQLKEVDLKIARADRKRRTLVRERSGLEKGLVEIEGVIEMFPSGSSALKEFFGERGKLEEGLDEVDISIAQLDRDRRSLKKKRKKLELWTGT